MLYGNLSEFVDMLWEVTEEEQQWQYFLAKVFDKSFDEFKQELKGQIPPTATTKVELEATVKESMNIMDTFIPED